MRNVGAAAVALVAAVVAVMTGCGTDEGAGDVVRNHLGPAGDRVSEVDTPAVRFRLRLGVDERVEPRGTFQEGCPDGGTSLRRGDDYFVTFESAAASCSLGQGNTGLGNGRHGVYRSADDIPATGRGKAQHVRTALGPAVVFDQKYFECTNSCGHWTEPVAVIALDHPADPGYSSLVIRSDRAALGHDDLVKLLKERLETL